MTGVATIRSAHQARDQQTMAEAFPIVEPCIEALGNMVLVQMRCPKLKSGGIIMPEESKDYDASMIRVGKVIQLGPIAYKKRENMEPWPEGAWVKVGDFVRVPAHAGVDSWRIFHDKDDDQAHVVFCFFNDYDMKGRIKGDPLRVIDYV